MTPTKLRPVAPYEPTKGLRVWTRRAIYKYLLVQSSSLEWNSPTREPMLGMNPLGIHALVLIQPGLANGISPNPRKTNEESWTLDLPIARWAGIWVFNDSAVESHRSVRNLEKSEDQNPSDSVSFSAGGDSRHKK